MTRPPSKAGAGLGGWPSQLNATPANDWNHDSFCG